MQNSSVQSEKQADKSHYGLIEAFYGLAWSREDRDFCLNVCPEIGLGHYLYAPKSDAWLRRRWSEPYPDHKLSELGRTLSAAQGHGLLVGVGLSPLGLAGTDDKALCDKLFAKVEQLNQLNIDWLGIFFDDMPSDGHAMVKQQLDIIEFIAKRSTARRIVVCPSYYSTDPVLDKVFGQRPTNYWQELGKGLDSSIDFFWTGERVCSQSYDRYNLEFIADQLRRLPVLWDNYPVNDGERLCRFLQLKPFSERPAWLRNYTRMHFANPMNQAYCSLLPLATLASANCEDEELQQRRWFAQAQAQLGDLAEQLQSDIEVFSEQGLDAIDTTATERYLTIYDASESPLAREICRWLRGDYRFDPSCLTD